MRKLPRKPAPRRARLGPTLLPLAALLTACVTPPVKPPEPVAIPPLPAEARQTDLPTFSQKLSAKLAEWQRLLTEQSSPD
jgi:hypothetical protein